MCFCNNYWNTKQRLLIDLLEKPRQRRNPLNTTNNQGNEAAHKENEKYPENKDMETCDSNDRELKIAVLKKLNEAEESKGRQFNELRNMNSVGKKPSHY